MQHRRLAAAILSLCGVVTSTVAIAAQPASLAEAVELIMVGGADEVTIREDPVVRDLLEKALARPTRVLIHVSKVADLGGEGCKRIGWRVIALDVPIRSAGTPDGYFATTAQWSICSNGQPPDADRALPRLANNSEK